MFNFFSYLFLLSYLICSHHATHHVPCEPRPGCEVCAAGARDPAAGWLPHLHLLRPASVPSPSVLINTATRYTVRKCILCLEYSKHLDQDLFNLKSIYKLQLHDGLAIHLRNFCTIIFHCFILSRSTAVHQFSVTYFIYSSPRFLMLPPPL